MAEEIRFEDVQPGDKVRGKDGEAYIVSAVSAKKERGQQDIVSLYEMGGGVVLCGGAREFLFLLHRPRPEDAVLGRPLAAN